MIAEDDKYINVRGRERGKARKGILCIEENLRKGKEKEGLCLMSCGEIHENGRSKKIKG